MLLFEQFQTISQNFGFFIQMPDFSLSIQRWYRQNKRSLPWRETSDPYFIWLSEVILQQTRIEQGTAYYLKFQEHYPKVEMLANAPEDEVLRLWQGLGYYSRARNLHAAAKRITEEFDGEFPSTFEDIQSLKGVGDYTASAIASFAFGLPHAVVDGNVYRFIGRYLKIDTPIDSTEGKKQFKEAAQLLMDPKNPGTHNQAMMEMGSLVCTVSNPQCASCPVNESCMAFEDNSQAKYPVKLKKTKVRNRYLHFLIVTDGKQLILKKRPSKGIWAGLYDFPEIEYEKKQRPTKSDLGKRELSEIEKDGTFKHLLSHQKIEATFWIAKVDTIQTFDQAEIIVDIDGLDDYPMPQLLIRYLEKSTIF